MYFCCHQCSFTWSSDQVLQQCPSCRSEFIEDVTPQVNMALREQVVQQTNLPQQFTSMIPQHAIDPLLTQVRVSSSPQYSTSPQTQYTTPHSYSSDPQLLSGPHSHLVHDSQFRNQVIAQTAPPQGTSLDAITRMLSQFVHSQRVDGPSNLNEMLSQFMHGDRSPAAGQHNRRLVHDDETLNVPETESQQSAERGRVVGYENGNGNVLGNGFSLFSIPISNVFLETEGDESDFVQMPPAGSNIRLTPIINWGTSIRTVPQYDAIFDQILDRLRSQEEPRLTPTPQEVIDQLPTFEATNRDDVCAVCLDSFKENVVTQLPCNHTFHKDCIIPWLEAHNTCPTCRKTVDSDAKYCNK